MLNPAVLIDLSTAVCSTQRTARKMKDEASMAILACSQSNRTFIPPLQVYAQCGGIKAGRTYISKSILHGNRSKKHPTVTHDTLLVCQQIKSVVREEFLLSFLFFNGTWLWLAWLIAYTQIHACCIQFHLIGYKVALI